MFYMAPEQFAREPTSLQRLSSHTLLAEDAIAYLQWHDLHAAGASCFKRTMVWYCPCCICCYGCPAERTLDNEYVLMAAPTFPQHGTDGFQLWVQIQYNL